MRHDGSYEEDGSYAGDYVSPAAERLLNQRLTELKSHLLSTGLREEFIRSLTEGGPIEEDVNGKE